MDFNYSDLSGRDLDGQTFIGVKFDMPALKDVSFQGATLRNVSFRAVGIRKYCTRHPNHVTSTAR